MKKKILGLITFLIGIGASFAMDVAPLYFVDAQGNRIAANLQQEYWNYLVKYKLFGNDFVKTGNRVIIHDESGWTGSNGYFKAEQPDGNGTSVGTQLGGPVVVAGNITVGQDYKFTTGPVRAESFTFVDNCGTCYFAAPICLNNTTVTSLSGNSLNGNTGFQAQAISNCPDQPSPNTAVSIPRLDWPASPTVADIKISANNGEQRIVVPDPVGGSKAPYDIYMDSILTGIGGTDGAKITVSMPAGGRVTRIFVHQIQLGNHTVIQIVYRTPQEDGSVVEVPAEKYVGNLLFYTDHDINIKNTDNSILLGTYVSTGRIFLQSNINFAGQLIANELVVGNEFDGRSFVFVPIDPPVLDLKPQADTPLEFPENDLLVKVPIALDTPAPADVFIDYCFDLQNSSAKESDFKLEDGYSYPKSKGHLFPICGQNMGKVTILKDAKTPADAPDVSVWINVAKDELVERPNETLRLKITNISGAVLPGNKLDGYFDLIIVDANIEPISEDFEIIATEDEAFTFDSSMFKYESAFDKVEQGVVIMSLPEKGFLLSNGDTLTSSDLNKFIPINETTNIDLQFIAAKDEYGVSPAYTSFTFKMKDADNVVSEKPYTVTVKVNPVNDGPTAFDTTFTVNENVAGETVGNAVTGKIRIADVDDSGFIYAFDANDANYAKVISMFVIDAKTGVVSVKSGVTLDYEALVADTTLKINVLVSDSAVTTSGAGRVMDTALVTLKVIDVNEAPEITKKGPFTVDENAEAGVVVDTVKATDPDIRNIAFSTLTYSIKETDVPFVIHPQTGVITVAAGAELDFETKPSWTIHAIVTDGHLSDTAEVVININDVNEPPVIDDIQNEYNVVENTANKVVFAIIKISDPDAGDNLSTLSAVIEDASAISGVGAVDLFDATVVEDENDHSLRIVLTVKDSAKLDYEALLENGADTVFFDIRLLLKDRGGSGLTDTAFTTVYVTDENEKPTAKDGDFTIAENSIAGTFVGQVEASDPDTANAAYGTLYYSFMTETTQFVIDEATGVITVAEGADLDYETTPDHKITLYVEVTDRGTEPQISTVVVTLTDENEKPILTCKSDDMRCKGPFDVYENSAKDSVIYEFVVFDVDAGDRGHLETFVADSNGRGADSLFTTRFNADSTLVQLIVKKGTNLDYENLDASYEIIIAVKDDDELNDTLIRTINLIDVNEAPVIDDRNFTPKENIADDEVIGDMKVTEPDTKNAEFRHLDFSIIETVPFYMDSNEVKVADASQLDFETTPEFSFRVVVKNCEKNASTGKYTDKCLTDTADVKVSLQNVNEKPDIKCIVGDSKCNGPFEIAENSKTGTEIHTFAITDVDANDAGNLRVELTDYVTTGIAATLFDVTLNAAHTEVTIVVKDSAKLNYEAVDSTYRVVLTVIDGDGATDTLIRTINIKDVNEVPTIADATVTRPENLKQDTVVAEVSATDPDTKHVVDFAHLEFSIITPDMPFWMDSNLVKVADPTKIDFETTPVFVFQVEVKNCEKNASTGNYTLNCLADTATVTVNLTNVNERPDIKCVAGDTKCNGPFEIAENSKTGTEIHTFAITDVDANDAGNLTVKLTDFVSGGIAATLFDVTLNAAHTEVTIVVKDSAKLNYEAVDSTYRVVLTVIDGDGATDTLIRTINIKDVNEVPTIADATVTRPENLKKDTVVAEVSATDPDTKHVVDFAHLDYSIITPDMPFWMDSNKVKVADSTKLDFETTPVFVFQVEVKNCEKDASTGKYTLNCLADTATVTVNLTNVNERPDIKCIAGDNDCNGPFKIAENSKTGTVIHSFAISDVDASDVLTVSLRDNGTTGADSLFDVKKNAAGTEVSIVVKDSSKLNYELVKKIHEVVLTVVDADGLIDTLIRKVEVTDVNEVPTVEDFDKKIEENLPNGTKVGELVAADPDTAKAFSHLTYTIIEENIPFTLDSNVIKVADSGKLNYEKDSVFVFRVKVSDGTYSDTAKVTIKLTDVNEKPKIIVDDGPDGEDDSDSLCVAFCDTTSRGHTEDSTLTVAINENVPTNTVVLAYVVADEDIGEVTRLVPSFVSNNGSGADSLFKIELKTTGGKTKLVVSVADSSKLNYEKVKHSHDITIYVTDPSGAKDSLVRIINVVDVNEAPTIENFDKKIEENLPNGTKVGELVAADPDTAKAFSHLTYTIIEENIPFTLDSNVIKVADSGKLNYEKDSVFVFRVKVSDGTYSDTAKVTIKLTDVDENPKIIVDDDHDGDDDTDSLCIAHCDTTGRGHDPISKKTLTVGVEENSPTNTVVFSYVVADEDFGDITNLVPTLRDDENSGTDSLFKIEMKQDGNKWKIVVSVADSSKLDYETIDPIHEVTVIVTDPNGLQDSIKRIIEVIDINEPPTFESWPFEFTEHNEPGTVVGHVEHGEDVDTMAISGISKPENYMHDKFALTGGADGADTLFTLLPNGDLVANKTFNFETDPTEYTIYISLMDTLMPDLVETDTIHITLLDLNEDPWIVTDSVVVEENVEKGTVIDTIEAKDLDLYDTVLTFTLVEDKSGCFDVSKSGVVTVKKDNCSELDYEKNHELPITVKVTDTKDASETKTIIVKITDVNEAPKIDDETITVREDTPIGTPVDTVKATDPDDDPKYSELVYTIVGGDSTVFQVDSTTGVVTLIDSLDYEAKSEYTLVVEVFDGEFRDTATVTIKVGNVIESSEVEITRAETRDTVVINPDTLYVNTPDVCIEWKADGKLKGPDCDLELHEGENIIIREFQDPTKDFPGIDTLVIYFSTATPVVTVSKAVNDGGKTNIFTIVEEASAKDTTFYVNETKNDILVTVTDTVTHTSESFTVKVELESVDIPSNTFKNTLGGLVDAGVTLNEHPTDATYTPVNGNSTAVTYTEKINGKNVTVTYYTDSEGNVIETADGIKTMTVTYTTEVEGREVRISYLADAVTGEVIQTSGGYTKQESGKDSKDGGKESGKGGKEGKDNKDSKNSESENLVVFTVTYDYVDDNGNIMTVAYGVDAEGNLVKNEDGNLGYEVSYTYTNKYGNSATRSLFIVVDQVSPVVEIITPVDGEVVYTNFIDVKWTVNGEVQDTLITQALEKGANAIVRFYRDKAGNQASDTIIVIMKNAKDVDIAVEEPVTVVTREKTEEYYATNEPEEGETFAITIYNTKTDKEVETQVGGSFDAKPGSGDEPYPGLPGHLGPTLGIDTKVPTVNAIGGLATLDDIVGKDGLVPLEGVDAANSAKITVDEYMDKYCDAEFSENVGSDISRANLFKTKMYVKIWIYTSLGQFVDYYSFTQDLDNPDYVNDAGLLTMYFEMKPDRDGNVRTESGRLYATGAYVYKTEVELRSTLRCAVPPFAETSKGSGKYEPEKASNAKGATRSVKEDLLKSFGYKRPEQQ